MTDMDGMERIAQLMSPPWQRHRPPCTFTVSLKRSKYKSKQHEVKQEPMDSFRNYHTHTVRCKHASDPEQAYIETAIQCGYTVLGFSDHAPWPFRDGHTSGVRMDLSQLEEYAATIKRLREQYKGQIEIKLGLECEYFPEHFGWLTEKKQEYGMDYLLLGNHFRREDETEYAGRLTLPAQLFDYAERCVKAMETGLFAYLCHPDLMLNSYPVFDAACADAAGIICSAAKDLGFPLEYNLLGQRYQEEGRASGLGYPCRRFWEIAGEHGCAAIIGVDAHAADHLAGTDRFLEARKLLTGLGCRLTDRL